MKDHLLNPKKLTISWVVYSFGRFLKLCQSLPVELQRLQWKGKHTNLSKKFKQYPSKTRTNENSLLFYLESNLKAKKIFLINTKILIMEMKLDYLKDVRKLLYSQYIMM